MGNFFLYNVHDHLPHHFSFLIASFLSIGSGFLIGWDRQKLKKPAGFRTFALVALGSTIFTLISVLINGGDPSRIIAQIVTGIGFIGAGAVFRSGKSIKGLTTAASIWVTAAMGCLFGLGFVIFGLSVGVLILILLIAYHLFEMQVMGECSLSSTQVRFQENGGKNRFILQEILSDKGVSPDEYDFQLVNNNSQLTINCCEKHPSHHLFLFDFAKLGFVEEIKQSSEM